MNFPYSGLLSLDKNSQGSILYNVNPSARDLIRFSVHKHVVHNFPFLSLLTQQILVQHNCVILDDHNRVKLHNVSEEKGQNYINASFIVSSI